MAATWICEKCGRANPGDLCPGCGEARPIRVRYSYIANPLNPYMILDGVSEPRFQPICLLLIAPMVILIFSDLNFLLKITLLTFFGLPLIWNSLLVPLRLAFYRRRSR